MTAGVGAVPAVAAIPTTPWEMIATASPVSQAVLAVLVLLSLVSWAIMLAKWWEFRRMRSASTAVLADFDRATSFDEVGLRANRAPRTPFTAVYDRAQRFMKVTTPALSATADRGARLSSSQVEALRLVLDAETDAEHDALAKYVPWLATIGSASPLIGLLGTVLGVIDAFIGIGTRGSGNIGAVAPGIAQALVATAAALSVAIPAVFGYNVFANRLNRLDSELEGFGSELIALLVREGRI
jgi:biopolymer transport protein TolQ